MQCCIIEGSPVAQNHLRGLKSFNSQPGGASPSFRLGHLGTNTVCSWHCGYFKISAAGRRRILISCKMQEEPSSPLAPPHCPLHPPLAGRHTCLPPQPPAKSKVCIIIIILNEKTIWQQLTGAGSSIFFMLFSTGAFSTLPSFFPFRSLSSFSALLLSSLRS